MKRILLTSAFVFAVTSASAENLQMDPKDLADLIHGSKAIFEASGGSKAPLQEEQVTMDFAFATVVTTTNIKKGEKFSHDNIWVKRPGTGDFSAEDYSGMIGKVAAKDIANDTHVSRSDVME